MADRKFTIVKGGDFGKTPGRGPSSDIEKRIKQLESDLDKRVRDGQLTTKQADKLLSDYINRIVQYTDADEKATRSITENAKERADAVEESGERQKRVIDDITERQERLIELDEELANQYKKPSRERLERLVEQERILRELVGLHRELGVEASQEIDQLRDLGGKLTYVERQMRQNGIAFDDLKAARQQHTAAVVKDTEVVEVSTRASRESTEAMDDQVDVVEALTGAKQKLREETERSNRSQSNQPPGGNQPPVTPPSGGGGGDPPDDDWDAYFQKQIDKAEAELTNAKAVVARRLKREVTDLGRSEAFAESAARLQQLRDDGVRLAETFRDAARQIIDTDQLKAADRALRNLEAQVTKASRALSEGRGDAQGLGDALRNLIEDTGKLADESRKLTEQDVIAYNTAKKRLEMQRNFARGQLGKENDPKAREQLQRVVDRADEALLRAAEVFAGDGTVDIDKTIRGFNDLARLTGEQVKNTREINRLNAERRQQVDDEVRSLEQRLRRDVERLETARKSVATARDQKAIDDQINIVRNRIAALDRARELGGVYREPVLAGLRFDTTKSWNDTSEAIRNARENSAEYERQVADTDAQIKRLIATLDEQRMAFYKAGLSDRDIEMQRARLERYQIELRKAVRGGRDISNIRFDLDEFGDALLGARAELNRFDAAIDRLSNRFGFLRRALQSTEANGRRFSLFTTIATVVLEPLLSIILGVASGLLSIASAAVGAGAALGGALVAGVAQALPALGLIAFAFKGLFDVIQISSQQQKDSVANLARNVRGVGGASDATNRLTGATEQLTSAQRRLSDARQQAIRDLEDLADKSRSAELASRQATLSVVEAEIALRDAQENGSVLDVERARIALDQARIGQRQAFRDEDRTVTDSAVTRRRGVEGNEQVVAARQALAQAERSLAQARTQGAAAAGGLTQATAVLDEQIRRLSPTQRDLLDSINGLRAAFSKGPFADIRDIILRPFVDAVSSISKVAKDSTIIQSFFDLATSISRIFERALDSLTGEGGRGLLVFLNGEAANNLAIISDGLASLASVFGKVIQAASPLLTYVLDGIAGKLADIDRALSTEGLGRFFEDQKPAIEAFGDVAEEAFVLLKNLFELSSPAGTSLVGTFGKFLGDINRQLADPRRRRELMQFFDEMAQGFTALATGIKDIGIALFGNLETSSLSNLGRILSEVIAPALGSLVQVSGQVSRVLGTILNLPFVPQLAAATLAITIFGKTWNTVAGILGGVRSALILTISRITDLTTTASLSGTGLVGFGGALDKSGEKTRGVTGRLAALRGGIRGIGTAVGALGPVGIAFATALLIFADPIADLIDRLGLLKSRAQEAREALNRVADAQAGKKDKALATASAGLDVEDSQVAASDARKRLDALDATVARRQEALRNAQGEEAKAKARGRLQQALAAQDAGTRELERAEIVYEQAKLRYDNAVAEQKKAEEAAVIANQQLADSIAKVASQARLEAGVALIRGKPLAGDTSQKQAERLAELLGLSDEAFDKVGADTKRKISEAVLAVVSSGGTVDAETAQLIINLAVDDKPLKEILAQVSKKQEIVIVPAVNQKALKQTNDDIATIARGLEGLIAPANALGFVNPGRNMNGLIGDDSNRAVGLPAYADGGIVRAKNGGQKIIAGEAGYDEYVITTDPKKRSRSASLIDEAARRLSIPPGVSPEAYGNGEGDPPSLGKKRRTGAVRSARGPLETFFRMFYRAKEIDDQDYEYAWGGGHITPARPTAGINSDGKDGTDKFGFDCSSSVSAVLQSAYPGFPTITSGQFPSQPGMQRGPGLVTIWSNAGHVFMTFGEQDWGTGGGNPKGGPGFNSHTKAGFTASHPSSLSAEVRDSGPFGDIYRNLRDAGLSEIASIGSQLKGLGEAARKYGNDFTGSMGLKSRLGAGLGNGIDKGVGKFLSQFTGFRAGGYTPSGSDSQPYVTVVHGGEGIIDAQSMRDVRSGKTGKDVVKDVVTAVVTAIKDGVEEATGRSRSGNRSRLRNSATEELSAFDKLQGFVEDIRQARKLQVDLNGGRAGGVQGIVKVFQQIAREIRDPKKFDITADVRRFVNQTPQQFRRLLNTLNGAVLRALAGIESQFDAISKSVEKDNERLRTNLTGRIEGSYNAATGLFVAGDASAAATGGSSAAEEARISSLQGQRDNLVQQREAARQAMNTAATTANGLRGKRQALVKVLDSLKREKNKKNLSKAQKNAIEREINRVSKLIEGLDGQIAQATALENSAREQFNESNTGVQGIESDIGAAQGARIDALISEATGGDLDPAEAARRLDIAANLATSTGDTQRLRAVIRARTQATTGNLEARAGAIGAELRRDIFKQGATAANSASVAQRFEAITTASRDRLTALQIEKQTLLANGLTENSTAIQNLNAQIAELETSIIESTKAYYEARLQNVDARMNLANARLRLAELNGDTAGAALIRADIGTLLQERITTLNEEINRLLQEGLTENSTEIIALRAALVEAGIALQENTNAINGTTNQNFSSTSWQLFRRAIFDGNSQLLSGFAQAVAADPTMSAQVIPAMATGGSIVSDGLVYAHRGERIIPASISRNYGSTDSQNIAVTINEAQQTADPVYLAKRLAFELAGR